MKGHYIDNQWVKGTGEAMASHNPATGALLWEGKAAAETEVALAVAAARSAFPIWAALLPESRRDILKTYSEILREQSEKLSLTISQETGKPLWESRQEVAAMAAKIDISIAADAERCPHRELKHGTADAVTRHKPHGVLGVLGPFNFPGHLPNGHIVPALLAGNCIVFKPSELTPLTGELMAICWEQAGLPPGCFNMVQGGRTTGELLAKHPGINGVLFTGSWKAGRMLSEHFGKHPEKILALEMGGNNPMLVTEVQEIESAVKTIIQSAYITAGQRCTCARRLILVESARSPLLIEALVRALGKLPIGPYTDTPEPFMGPLISPDAAGKVLEAEETLIKAGGVPLVKMQRRGSHSAFITPGLIDVTSIADRPDEEIFGPLLQLIRVPSFEKGIEEANKTGYGLAAGLLSTKEEEYRSFYAKINSGVINWNTPLTGASSAAPFGGIGRSGNHRPSAYYAADYCSYPVASMEARQITAPQTPGLNPQDKS